MYKLYVEPSDEITTVIERLKAASEDVVAVIAPKGATLLQSIVNLKLARKAATDAGKTIVLVSTDKIGRNLALQLGIPVAATEKEVPSVLEEGSHITEGDAVNVIGGVRIHRYYDEAKDSEEEVADEKQTKQEPIIIPKKITKAAEVPEPEPIAEADKETKPEKSEIPTEAESVAVTEVIAPKKNTPLVTPVEAATVTAAENIGPITRTEAIKPLSAAAIPPDDTSISRTSMRPKPAPNSPRSKRRQLGPLLLYCTLLLILVAFAFSFLFLPSTKATVNIPATSWSKQLTFTASTALTSTSSDQTQLPAKIVTADVTDSVTFSATGTKDVGNPATGNLTLCNNASTTPQSVPSGTTVTTTSGNVSFNTTADATVPGYQKPVTGPQIPGCTSSIPVTAVNPGTTGNVTNAVINPISTSTLSLTGTVSASGGTSQVLPVVQQSDIDAAKTALTNKLTTDAQQKMQDTLKSENVHFDATTDNFTQDTPSVNVNAGDQTSSGQVQGTAHLARLIVNDSDIDTAAAARITSAAPANTVEEITQTTVTQFTVSKDVKTVNISTTSVGKESTQVSLTTIKKGLIGKTLSNGLAYVDSIVPNTTITVTQNPSWWPFKHYPYFSHWLTLSVNYE